MRAHPLATAANVAEKKYKIKISKQRTKLNRKRKNEKKKILSAMITKFEDFSAKNFLFYMNLIFNLAEEYSLVSQ